MNIINKALLQIALLPKGLYNRMGVDTNHLSAILQAKLTIDDRRPNTIHQTKQRKQNKPISTATLGTMFLSALMGLVFLSAFSISDDIVTQFTFYFSCFLFMLSASLISDFTAVLIDVRDNLIILPKPVNDSTVVISRILHITIHISKLIFPMAIPGMIYLMYYYNFWGGLTFLIVVVFITLFAIFLINASYLLVLKITTPARFQSIISYVQVVFAIAIYGGYQLMPRMIHTLGDFKINAETSPFWYLIPPYWFAAGWKAFYYLNGSTSEISLAMLCFTLPLFNLYLIARYLAPAFSRKMVMTGTALPVASGKLLSQKKSFKPSGLVDSLSRILTHKGAERMGFLFTWKMTARSRDFILKVYPSSGYILIFAIIMFFNKNLSLSDFQDQTGNTKIIVLSALYMSCYVLVIAANQMIYSEKYKSAWFIFIAPVQQPGYMISGALKAVIIKFFLPLAILLLIAGYVLLGTQILPNLILGIVNDILIAVLLVYAGKKQLPFSQAESNNDRSGTFLRGFSILVCSGLIALLHSSIYNFMPVIILLTIVSGVAIYFLFDAIQATSWQQINKGSIQNN